MADGNNTKYYHFAYNDSDRTPASEPPSISAKERVAKILRETELEDIPDLVFRSSADSKAFKKSKKSGSKEHVPLYTDHELFTIDDEDDWDFEGELNIEDYPKSAQRKDARNSRNGQNRQGKRTGSANAKNGRSAFDTYIDDSVGPSSIYKRPNSRGPPRQTNTSTPLTMTAIGDDTESYSMQQEPPVDAHDTQPIITVSQADLVHSIHERHRRKVSVATTITVVLLGLLVLVCAFGLIVYFSTNQESGAKNVNETESLISAIQ